MAPARAHRTGDWLSSLAKASSMARVGHPLPPPPRTDKATQLSSAVAAAPSHSESPLAAIKALRRAQGLCFKCAGKWHRDHKCPPKVLMAVEAIWEGVPDVDSASEVDCSEPPPSQLFMAISKAALQGTPATCAIRLHGSIQRQSVVLLVDSGSSASFISESLAACLQGVTVTSSSSSVQVAGGGVLPSSGVLLQLPWSVDSSIFHTDFRLLKLQTYDAIVGMDWLSTHSLMLVDWDNTWLVIPHQGRPVLLQGIQSAPPSHLYVQVYSASDTTAPELSDGSIPP